MVREGRPRDSGIRAVASETLHPWDFLVCFQMGPTTNEASRQSLEKWAYDCHQDPAL